MKRWMVPALLFLATAISACSSARESIKEKNVGIRGDVFE